MGFFSGILSKAAPLIGGALGTLVAPGIGTAIGSGLGGMVGGSAFGGESGSDAGAAYGGNIGNAAGQWFGKNVGSFIESGMNSYSAGQAVNQQNQLYKDRFDDANAFSAESAQKNRDFQQSMFDQAAAYNTNEAQKARDTSWSMMGESQRFNAEQADLNRGFQKAMSDTQYQRAVGDMKAAGLNPMLAYSQGGAGGAAGATASSAPGSSGGASISAQSGSAPSSVAPAAIASALDFQSQLEQRKAQTDLLRSQTEKVDAEAATERARPDQVLAQIRNIDTDTVGKGNANVISGLEGQLKLLQTQWENANYDRRRDIELQAGKIQNQLNTYRLPGAKAESDFFKAFGQGDALGSASAQGFAKNLMMFFRLLMGH